MKVSPFNTMSVYYDGDEQFQSAVYRAMPTFEYPDWAHRKLKDFVLNIELPAAHQFGIDVGNSKDFNHVLFVAWARDGSNEREFTEILNHQLQSSDYPQEFIDAMNSVESAPTSK